MDFHATRHTYISGIVAGKASVKDAMELARHSTPTLTIGRYAHARLHDLTAALDALPDLTTPPVTTATPAVMTATGTDGRNGQEKWGQIRGHLSGRYGQNGAACGGPDRVGDMGSETPTDGDDLPQVFILAGRGNTRENAADKKRQEALAGVEPAVADLQSAALATWPQRR